MHENDDPFYRMAPFGCTVCYVDMGAWSAMLPSVDAWSAVLPHVGARQWTLMPYAPSILIKLSGKPYDTKELSLSVFSAESWLEPGVPSMCMLEILL